jgi:PX domain
MENNNQEKNQDLMYLPRSLWSPRYESNFFTIQIKKKRKVMTIVDDNVVSNDNDNNNTTGSNNSNNDDTTMVLNDDSILFSSQLLKVNDTVIGKSTLPAYYYEIILYQQHSKRIIYRRYSQFQWLHNQLTTNNNTSKERIQNIPNLPTGSESSSSQQQQQCFFLSTITLFGQNDEFAQNRLIQLSNYLCDVLSLPGYANHPAMVTFLELL